MSDGSDHLQEAIARLKEAETELSKSDSPYAPRLRRLVKLTRGLVTLDETGVLGMFEDVFNP